jgi:hypothetical protein
LEGCRRFAPEEAISLEEGYRGGHGPKRGPKRRRRSGSRQSQTQLVSKSELYEVKIVRNWMQN